MGYTNFPNGIRVGNSAGVAGTLLIGSYQVPVIAAGTGLTDTGGKGTVTTGLGGVLTSFQATFRNNPAGGGTTIGPFAGSAVSTGGGVATVQYYDAAGVAGTAAAPFYWVATGTA